MSPILVAGLTIAMRFILDDCCARAASGHVAAAPSAVMKSRRRMYPPEGKPLRRLKPNTLRGAEGEKGQPIDPKRCDPMVAVGTRISPRPPHRSRRALLTHRAPPSGRTSVARPA